MRLSIAGIQKEVVARPCGVGCMPMPFVLGSNRSRIFPRDPDFAARAGTPFLRNDFVISADRKTSVQAPPRKQPTLALTSHGIRPSHARRA